MRACFTALLLCSVSASAHPCETCHPAQVRGYLRTGMGRSLRSPERAPNGSFEHYVSRTTFQIRSNASGLFQRMTHEGQNSDFRVDAVIGSGNHASCYAVRMGDHLFQSPICFYNGRGYGMAPGYEENAAPGFTRP